MPHITDLTWEIIQNAADLGVFPHDLIYELLALQSGISVDDLRQRHTDLMVESYMKISDRATHH